MSSTNKTTNYNLSQFVGTDVPSYLGDYNGDMSKIDKAIGDVANSQGSVEQSVTGLTAEVQGLSTQVSGVSTSVQQLQTSVAQIDSGYKQADTALSQRITTNANNIQTNTTAIESANTAIGNINTAIGTTDISGIGDGTIKGAISSINSSLTNSGTIRYNEATHYIQVLIDGEWVNYKYFNNKEIVALIPTMTSNTLPSGKAISVTAQSGFEAYKAFDNNSSTFWAANNSDNTFANEYLMYEFPEEVTITKITTINCGIYVGGSHTTISGTISLLTSLNGNDWNEIKSVSTSGSTSDFYLPENIELDNPVNCKFIKLIVSNASAWNFKAYELQAYGYK